MDHISIMLNLLLSKIKPLTKSSLNYENLAVSILKMVTPRRNIWKFLKILPNVKPLQLRKNFAPSLEMTFAFLTNWPGINEPKCQDGTTREMNKSIFPMLTDVKRYIWILIWSIYFILIVKIGKVLEFRSLTTPPITYNVFCTWLTSQHETVTPVHAYSSCK